MNEREKLHEILDLVLDLNEQGKTAFFEYAGHVEKVSVRVYEEGWKPYADATYEANIYVDEEMSDVGRNIDHVIEELKVRKGEQK
jgi:hypothetical protein